MSRLLDSSEEFRRQLLSRNLYNPNSVYEADNPAIFESINNIINVIYPPNTIDLTNNLASRIIDPTSPLAQAGLRALGTQFLYTVASQTASEIAFVFNPRNALDGDFSDVLTRARNARITDRDGFLNNVGELLERFTGIRSLALESPFNPSSTNADYIRNTGSIILSFYYDNINRNLYKKSDQAYVQLTRLEGFNLVTQANTFANRNVFTNTVLFPSNDLGNSRIIQGLENNPLTDRIQGYAQTSEDGQSWSNTEYIDALLGTTKKTFISNLNNPFEPTDIGIRNDLSDGFIDDIRNQIIWGRDGFKGNNNTNVRFGKNTNDFQGTNDNLASDFNVRRGLLKYTAELANASEGNLVDQTRKIFYDPVRKDRLIGFNGGSLFKVPSDALPYPNGNLPNDGVRQHNILSQYNNFAKAIRYNGNNVFEGTNPNSVIHNTVIPDVAPYFNGDELVNKNLFFSIENLQSQVYRDDQRRIAILDDEEGTILPIHEAGQFGGRVMWFAPYGIEVNEQVNSRHETTTFIGRGEPIYTYGYTERTATLSFILLIDYPPQLRGRNHSQASNLFAFGSTSVPEITDSDISTLQNENERLRKQIDDINNNRETFTGVGSDTISFYFKNDEPNENQINSIIDTTISERYQIIENSTNPATAEYGGANNEFFTSIVEVVEKYTTNLTDEQKEFTMITIRGYSSLLFNGNDREQYNFDLSVRRIQAMENYLRSNFNIGNIQITTDPNGDEGATQDSFAVDTIPAINRRRVDIIFTNNTGDQIVELPLSLTDQETIRQARETIQQNEQIISNTLNEFNQGGFVNTFVPYTLQDGVLRGFKSSEQNKFQPVFYSQTPEDFHRRLTFLQQMMRQGNAIRDNVTEGAPKNSVFGRQPVSVLRLGDQFHTEVIVESMNIDYEDSLLDLNSEGFGGQFRFSRITLGMKLIGGQSIEAPINAIQNAVTFNYYANSTFVNKGIYRTANKAKDAQISFNESINEEQNRAIRERNRNVNDTASSFNQNDE